MKEDLLNVVGNFIETELDYVEKSNNEIKQLQNQVEKLTQENNDMEERIGYLERSNNRKEETIIELRKEQELDKYKSVIDKAINQIEITIETIKQQPSKNIKDDEYLIVRLKSFINILGSKE